MCHEKYRVKPGAPKAVKGTHGGALHHEGGGRERRATRCPTGLSRQAEEAQAGASCQGVVQDELSTRGIIYFDARRRQRPVRNTQRR